MSHTDTEERLTRIETKLSFAEDLLEALNQLAFRQQSHIERLENVIATLLERTEQSPATRISNPREEIPPHY